jgi:O-6-methylguanine DNA methyltransferase
MIEATNAEEVMALSLGEVPQSEVDARLVAIRTTNIFCRPGCPAPAPMPPNVEHYSTPRQALFAGYRPCLRCRPLEHAAPAPTDAEVRRAERLRAVLRAARETRRSATGRSSVALRLLTTPLGPVLVGATAEGICLLEFTDRPMLPTQLEVLARRLRCPLVAGRHRWHDVLHDQLNAYFAGQRAAFDVPLVAPGSPFQERTWAALRRIPPGTTQSYEELALEAGRPGAQRAVGTANGANRIALLLPCHRVVRKGGGLGGYGGGLWRKAWLLDHERRLAVTVSGPLATAPRPELP